MGWRGYFGFCQTPHVLTNLEAWIRRRLRFVSLAAVANRANPLQRTMPSRHIEVQCGGGGRLAHGHLANVRTPVGPTGAARRRGPRAIPSSSETSSATRTQSSCDSRRGLLVIFGAGTPALRQDHFEDDADRPPKHSWTGLRRHAERGQSQEQPLGEQGIQKGV